MAATEHLATQAEREPLLACNDDRDGPDSEGATASLPDDVLTERKQLGA